MLQDDASVLKLWTRNDDDGRRLDRVLRKCLKDLPLSAVYRLFRQGRVKLQGRRARGDERVRAGQEIEVRSIRYSKKTERPEKEPDSGFKLDILWEGAGLLIVNKPSGIAVHGPGKDGKPCLDDEVRAALKGRIPPSLSFKPGPLHRLDKGTSGCVAFSTSLRGARFFSDLLRQGLVKKTYLAIVEGPQPEKNVWEDMLLRDKDLRKTLVGPPERGGQKARTRVYPLATSPQPEPYTLLRLELDTGRTHQIRAQAAFHQRPLAGDTKYGGHPIPRIAQYRGFFLHALSLEVPLPGETAPLCVTAPLPEPFKAAVQMIFPGRS